MELLQFEEHAFVVFLGPKFSALSLVRLSQTCRLMQQRARTTAAALLQSDEFREMGNSTSKCTRDNLGALAAAISAFYALVRLAQKPIKKQSTLIYLEFGYWVCEVGGRHADITPAALEKIHLFALAIGEFLCRACCTYYNITY